MSPELVALDENPRNISCKGPAMADEHAIEVWFSCSGCDQLYLAYQSRRAALSGGDFKCPKCGCIVATWDRQYFFSDWICADDIDVELRV